MPYIKIDGNRVTLAGMVQPDEDWVLYEGDIPQGTDHIWDEATGTVQLSPEYMESEKTEAISNLKQNRETSLQALTHTFSTGEVVQVRPQDLPNFQIAISLGASEDWVMADDTVVNLTVAQMQEAMDSGIAQGKVIWKTYTADLKAII
jgi:hypothetical protein